MKKTLKWMGIAVLTPILLFIILTALLYLPPIQNWAVKKVAAIASEKTGMEITVEYVSLSFPLDLSLEGFRALHPNDSLPHVTDTIADVKELIADVRLLPLLKKRVVIDELSLHQAKINTNGFIGDLRIKGELDELWLSSKGIDLDKETIEVNGARLADAKIDIALSDTAAADTSQSETKWKIFADSLTIAKTDLALHLPGDTLNVKTYLGLAVARGADVDLDHSIYQIASFDWHDGALQYDNKFEPDAKGLDYNHLALTDIRLGIDSISYTPSGTSLYIRQTALKEKSGLEIKDLNGGLRFDSTFTHMTIPALALKTPDSDIYTEVDMDFNAFEDIQPGNMRVRLNAQLGKQDLMCFMGNMPQKFIERYPNHPLSIKGSINGNAQMMDFTGLDISLPTALHMTASGTAENITDMRQLKANVKVSAQTQDLNFALALAGPTVQNDYRIPHGITLDGTLKANGTRYGTDMTITEGSGKVKMIADATIPMDAKGEMRPEAITYDADISIQSLNLNHWMPKDSLYTLTADIKAKGHGTDFLSNQSRLTADAKVVQLHYGSWDLRNLSATANLQDGRGQFSVTGHNELFDGTIGADAVLSTQKIEGTITANLAKADLYQMRLVPEPLIIGFTGDIDINSDLNKTHRVSGLIGDILIQDESKKYYPDRIGVLLKTSPDTTCLRAQSGDFIVKFDSSGDYEQLMSQLTTLTDSVKAQFEEKIIDQPAIKRLLPVMKIHVESKQNNPIVDLLRTSDISFKELLIDVNTSPVTGINGQSYLYSLNYDSTRIDTIRLNLTQKGERLSYQGQIRNNRRNPQFVFNALIDGHIHQHGILAGLRYYDSKDRMGMRIGATVDMEEGGIRFKLMPDRPTVGYKEFNLNKDNFIFLANNRKIQAKVDLIADDKTGMKLYTENQDSTMLQDLTVSLNRIDLGTLTSVLPYAPQITGYLNGDYHIMQDRQENISVASDMSIDDMVYEGSQIGNISSEFVYMMKEDDTHAINARLMLDDEEFGQLDGTYQNEGPGHIDATFTMARMPLSLVNGFIDDQIIGLDGYGEGSITIRGTTSKPDIDGEIFVEDAHLISIPYGIRMRFDNDPIRIVDSRLLLENFGLYAYNDEPLNMMGEINFSDMNHITMDMRMRARNFMLINAKQEAKSVAWGKAFVNFVARLQGPLETLSMRGRLDVLGSTDMTYMLLDSPLSTDNRLDELVKFTDFSDSTQTVVTRPTPSGLDVDLTISVAQGARIVCDLNTEQTNYIDLMGGGDLRLRYNAEGINLTGRYTLANGEMKYSLPVIPLKTFTVKDGSYVEFTGDPTNPKLNITATERTKATVNDESGASRSVTFDCGVIITKTLNDMGLQFIIDAPEDQAINGELITMSDEERGKIAVTMLTTGMYLADGNTGSFSMNSALSSFLQSEINSIAGSALKTLDLSVGIDNTTDATGAMHTDYSFKFAKRFFNNRLRIELGGKVSSGNSDAMGQNQSFFDNVTMEYRLNQEGTQNLKVFYNQNVYDWLDGYTGEYGVGFVWRRKLANLWEIFSFGKKRQTMLPQPSFRPVMRNDSIGTDSIRMESIKMESEKVKE
jgi:hypothetical protein